MSADNEHVEIVIDSIVRQTNKQVVSGMSENEAAMLNIEHGTYFHLNETAYRLWEMIESPCEIKLICSTLAREYDVEQDHCESMVLSLVDKMVKSGKAEVIDAAAA
ncbi:MAG: PqqD family peptide modification chaperone [Planctomycetales bacterium]